MSEHDSALEDARSWRLNVETFCVSPERSPDAPELVHAAKHRADRLERRAAALIIEVLRLRAAARRWTAAGGESSAPSSEALDVRSIYSMVCEHVLEQRAQGVGIEQLATSLGVTPNYIRVAACRARKRGA